MGIKKFKKYGSDNITNKDFEELNAKFKSLEKDNARMYAQNNFLKLEIKKLEKQISEKGLIKKPVKSLLVSSEVNGINLNNFKNTKYSRKAIEEYKDKNIVIPIRVFKNKVLNIKDYLVQVESLKLENLFLKEVGEEELSSKERNFLNERTFI